MPKLHEDILGQCKLRILNQNNGAHYEILDYAEKCLTKFDGRLNAVIMGIAYGGEVEAIARMWKGRGDVYGYDTFEELHPKHLAENPSGFEATCMEGWYKEYGTDELNYKYQTDMLAKEGLCNAHLIKGEINKDSCKDLPYINLAFLDMDIIASMKTGWDAVKDKISSRGYCFMHDAIPAGHLPEINHWVFNQLVPNLDGMGWDMEGVWRPQFLVGFIKK